MQATLTYSAPLATRRPSTSSAFSLERSSAQELLDRSQTGDLDARHALLGRYRSVIHATVSRMSSNRQDAEDLDTEVYLHVFKVINSCKNIQTLPAWIKRVAINEVYQAWRRKGRQPLQTSLDAVLESCGDSVLRGDESENPATILVDRTEKAERSERLKKALGSLPAHQRILCELYYEQLRSFEEISQETGVAMGTIKSRLFRARESMLRKMGDLAVA
ncbi:sigma-70 family RNA polymerase sigma factor [Armatimonas sp.]|uniref:RNA polymerase sigma factor n=1 Tax=Armatimonas sp. TaxID=1872638 RepID=UPI00286C1474|nr:sigma-70 family RNA polymerase sigma factor [Armatimonas sp.]